YWKFVVAHLHRASGIAGRRNSHRLDRTRPQHHPGRLADAPPALCRRKDRALPGNAFLAFAKIGLGANRARPRTRPSEGEAMTSLVSNREPSGLSRHHVDHG